MREHETIREARQRIKDQKQERRGQIKETIARTINERAEEKIEDSKYLWYVGLYESGKWDTVQHILLNTTGIHSYMPIKSELKGINRYRKAKRRKAFPIMPGGVFIAVEKDKEHWFHIFTKQRTMTGVIKFEGFPWAIEGHEVREFIDGNRVTFSPPKPELWNREEYDFSAGDKVRIIDGALDDFLVDVKSLKGKRAVVIGEMFGAKHEMEIEAWKLQKESA